MAPHSFAVWVRDALKVAYDQVRHSLHRTTAQCKRLYDVKAVNRKFPVGSWVLRYYPPVGIPLGWATSSGSTGNRPHRWHT